MKVVFLGCTKFSEELLKTVYQLDSVELQAIFTIPKSFRISYSSERVTNYNFVDLSDYADKWGVPIYEVDSLDGKRISEYERIIREKNPDVLLVLGWYYKVPERIRDLAKFGAWGIHASLLPDYAGGAPLVWAIINGEKESGVTLFRLSDGVDDGDIISQASFNIGENETIKEVYLKATNLSKKIVKEALTNVDQLTFTPQDTSRLNVYPQRNPNDGEINLEWPAKRIHDFIRAQSSPYPGAFIKTSDGKKLIIEKARIEVGDGRRD